MADPQLVVDDLHVRFPTTRGLVKPSTVSFTLEKGQMLGIVGESSWKSVPPRP